MKRPSVATRDVLKLSLRERIQASGGSSVPRLVPASLVSWNACHSAGHAKGQKLAQQITRLQQHVRHALVDSVMALVAAVEAKDPYTEQHSINVAAYAEELSRRAGLTADEIEVIVIAALLHDVGKIGIPDAILKKQGALTTEEFEVIKQHPARGVAILRPMGFLERELPLVLHHHEWHNGNGYPYGLSGHTIPFGAKIVQVADCVDAMLSPRSYKDARTMPETILELRRCRGTQFDPAIADLACEWLREHQPAGCSVC